MLGGFLKGYYAAAIEDFKNKKIDKKLFLKMQRVQQTDFNQEFFYKKWKMHSKQCLEYLSTSLKGSLCAACDPIESKRFEKLQVKDTHGNYQEGQYVYNEDLQLFSIKCNKYLDGMRVLHQLVRDVALTWNYFRREKLDVIPKVYSADRAKKIYLAMKKCGLDAKNCNNKDVIQFYTLAPLTGYDYFVKPYVEKMSQQLKEFFMSNSSAYGNALADFNKQLDETKDFGPKKENKDSDVDKVEKENHDGFATFQFFRQKNPLTIKYEVAPKELGLKVALHNFDKQLSMPYAINHSYFLGGRNSCKLVSLFGGVPIAFNRFRPKKKICSNVEWSCCTASTFNVFKYNAELGFDRLKTYYYNGFLIDIWF